MFRHRSLLLSNVRRFRGSFIFLLAGALARPVNAQIPVSLDPAEASLLAPAAGPRRAPAIDPATLYDPAEAERFRVLRSSLTAAEETRPELRLRALKGFLDYDDEEQVLYGPGRTQIEFGNMFLEADRVIIDNRLQEVQAEGNVILRFRDTEKRNEINADSMRYNFAENEGVAFNVEGEYEPMFFKSEPSPEDEAAGVPPFRQVSEAESLFRNTSITSCNFKVPHYRIRAREIILFAGDRIFFRGATFYINDIPTLYLPFFTRSMTGGSPWFVQLGSGGDTGARMRIGYQYQHQSKEPSLDDDDEYITRSHGQAQALVDLMAQRGLGGGFNYKYKFEFGRHEGEFESYAINDTDREVGENKFSSDPDVHDEAQRWQILWRHRSEITEHTTAVINVDAFSDPEIFDDILDRFKGDSDSRRYRQPVRRGRAAITYVREAWVARILVEAKDRVGIDRFNDFSDPSDNNNDFDFDPGVKLKDSDSNSIANDRWGRVSERLPEVTIATRYLPIGRSPFYFMHETRAFNNLDKGLNTVDDGDDAFVRGVDIYNQLLWQHKLTERYILLARIGVGVGLADRQDDDLGAEPKDLTPANDGLILLNKDGDFLVGSDTFNLDDIEPFFAYIDAALKLNARFSDALTGFVEWQFRETTDDFIGDFYAEVGDLTSREDLFDFRLREHLIKANLTYTLLHPSLVVFANAGANLKSGGDIFPSENVGFWNLGGKFSNRRRTFLATASIGQTTRQLLHPSDPGEGEQTSDFFRARAEYRPIHGRWHTSVNFTSRSTSGRTVEDFSKDRKRTFFSDEESRTRVTWIYGRELGPKWDTEFRLKWDDRVDGLRDIEWILQRDLHDAVAIVRIRSEQNEKDVDDREDNSRDLDITFGLKLKLPDSEAVFGAGDITTLAQQQRSPVLAY